MENKSFFISFGQGHIHYLNGETFDKNCIIKINADNLYEAVKKTQNLFGDKYSRIYKEKPNMRYFPRGIMEIE